MAISTEVKCGRCDKRYSALRGRCPYCGARRGSKGKFAGDPDNMQGRMIVGILILVALLAAVVTLIFVSVRNAPEEDKPPVSTTPVVPGDDDIDSIVGPTIEPSPSEAPVETFVPPPPTVQSVTITYNGGKLEDFTEKVGTTLTLKVSVVPDDIDIVPVWESDDTSVFDVVAADTSGLSARVTILGKGNATLTVTVGDVTATCTVRGRA